MDAHEFKKRLAELERATAAGVVNTAGHNLVDCERCVSCVFCTLCERCYRCTYCTDCRDASHLTHCVRSSACHHSSNLVECVACNDSAYLVQSRDCSECVYCFGCVGLVRAEFHILNEPYGRTEYFELTASLCKQLGIR